MMDGKNIEKLAILFLLLFAFNYLVMTIMVED